MFQKLANKIEEIHAVFEQSRMMEAAWEYGTEFEQSEADDINAELAIAAGEVKDWYDADTHEYIGTW